MKRRFHPSCLLAALALFAGACVDSPSAPVADAAVASTSASDEAAALNVLTRAVALALREPGLRQRVKADLRASRFTTEHKLPLSAYLNGESGGILLAKMAKETGTRRADLLALVGRVRPLEFYMPVQAHRESWTGGANLYVGGLLEDHTVPVVYDLNGIGVTVAADAVPEHPTLALVPVETDFNRPLGPAARNRRDRGGDAIGTYVVEPVDCPPDALDCTEPDPGTGGGYTPPPLPRGLYYIGSNLQGVGEGGLKGKPEIEVWVIRAFDPNKLPEWGEPRNVTCQAGENKSGNRYFNQDAENWSGRVTVLDSAELVTLGIDPTQPYAERGFTVQLWEDDSVPCELKTTFDISNQFMQLTSDGKIIYGGIVIQPWERRWITIDVPRLIKTWDEFWGMNDEYLGIAVPRETVPYPGHDGYTHIMFMDRTDRNGAIKLEFR